MIERLALILSLSLAAALAYYALRYLHARRIESAVPDGGTPTLFYFRGETCAVCPTQGRIVDQLASQWDSRLRVERIDAERDPEVAARYSVFTLPTTVLVGADGRVRQVNYGLADGQKLGQQVAGLLAGTTTNYRPQTTEDGTSREKVQPDIGGASAGRR
jgi:thiol-disulfide isomerase/thioredoxin